MPLNIELHHDDVTWSVETRKVFDRAVDRLRDRLSRYGLHANKLVATFEPRGDNVQARLDLAVEGDAQTAMVVEDSADKAVRSAFDTLFLRFDAYAWNLDHSRWQPLSRRTREEQLDRDGRYRRELLQYALPALHRVAVHDIERLRDEELLPEDWLDPAEVVDSAIADRLPQLDTTQPMPKATMELIRAVREELMARLTELHEQQNSDTSFETPMQESLILTDAEEAEWPLDTLTLNLGDVLQDPELMPLDEVVAEKERRDQLVHALFELPDPWRPLFAQVVVDGWAVDTVAAAWNTSVDEIQRAIQESAERLASLLGDVSSRDVVALYRALGERLHEERRQRDLAFANTPG